MLLILQDTGELKHRYKVRLLKSRLHLLPVIRLIRSLLITGMAERMMKAGRLKMGLR